MPNFREDTRLHKVHKGLLTHEFTHASKIANKVGIPLLETKNALSTLRSRGLAESSGKIGTDIKWKGYPIEAPLYPPQPPLRKMKKKKEVVPQDVSTKARLTYAVQLVSDLAKELQEISKEQFVETNVVINGETYYKKVK